MIFHLNHLVSLNIFPKIKMRDYYIFTYEKHHM